jgi:VWFA-related protein
MPKSTVLLPVLIFALLVNTPGQTQQPPPPQTAPAPATQDEDDEVVRITTNLVQLDAVVTDKNGKQVTNLTADDFEIVENGKPQAVTSFSYIRTTPPATAAATPAPPVAATPRNAPKLPPDPPVRLKPSQVQRTIALVVDDLGLSAESIRYVRSALRKYVNEQVQPGDLVAIIRTSASVGSLQQFTNDRQLLHRAIERVRWSPRHGGRATALENTIGAETPGGLPDTVDSYRTGLRDIEEQRMERFTVGTLGSLNFIVRGLRELPGRKAVVLFSDGILLRDSRGDTQRYLTIFERLIDLANRSSVVFYAIDARGVEPAGVTAADDTAGSPAGAGGIAPGIPTHQIGQRLLSARRGHMIEGQAGLRLLADATGGTALIAQNDLGKGIRRALDDMSGYYLIGYRPDESAFDPATGRVRFNSLSVRLKNSRGLRVRSRSGYVGVADEEARPQPRTRTGQLMSALISPFGAEQVNVRLTSLFINTPQGGSALRSMLLIDPRTLTFKQLPDGQQETVLDLIAVTFGENGRLVDQVNRIETIRVRPEDFQRFLTQGMVYDLNVPIKRPGAYQLRIAVRDQATERVGSASQYVEVPDLGRKRLTLSGLVVAPPQEQTTAAADDRQAGPATRRFRRGSLLDYGFVIYNAKFDRANRPRLTMQARLFREGQQVYAGQEQPVDLSQQTRIDRFEAAGRLQLGADLPAGEYVLQVVVTDALANSSHRTTTQWIDFELVN